MSNRQNRLPIFLWLLISFLSLGFILFFIVTSPASASILPIFAVTPTQENLWAYAEVPKPTHTTPAVPTVIPADTPAPAPTDMPTEIPAMVMSIVDDTVAPVQEPSNAPSMGGGKYILVDISEQHMYVYEGDALVYSFVASTGINGGTRVGTFAVQSKITNAYGSTWDIWMPNWLGIYWSGGLENGIHALPILPSGATLWEGYLGSPVSYGCVVLGTYDSQLLYDWAEIGTPVEIQW
jgi:lipoprotein-anchoring transpeptidase ErfK/SrfK